MAGRRVHFVFPAELVDRVDGVLPAGVSRGEWVRRAVERALSETKEPSTKELADPGLRTPGEGRSAAPAEQPERPPAEVEALGQLSRVEAFRRATQKR